MHTKRDSDGMIGIVDCGIGNLGSIQNMLKKIGAKSQITSDTREIRKASKLILPGVGAFDTAMEKLEYSGILPVLGEKVLELNTPILGICLGMQLFFNQSEEGALSGLSWIDGEVQRFRFEKYEDLKIPHMGWNSIEVRKNDRILSGLNKESRFYFVHSYHVVCKHEEDILTTTHYGYDFPSSVRRENIMGVQFHPEKSHRFGMQLLKNFAESC
jgi:glutamine amidotransferase